MTFREIGNYFNQKNNELIQRIKDTKEYKEYVVCSDLERRRDLVRELNHIKFVEKQETEKECCDYLIQNTTFKENSPYICDLSVEIKGQKIIFGNRFSLNGGGVSSLYKKWIKEKNEENKKSVQINEGDIYVCNNQFYRVKKTTEKSVVVEQLGKVCISTDYNEDDFRKTCMKEENFVLEYSFPVFAGRSYYFHSPRYTITSKERPNNEVVSTIKTTVVFENGNTILRNKANGLDITEKFSGDFIEVKYSSHNQIIDKSVVKSIEGVISECHKKSEEMTEDYYKTPEGIKEKEELERKIEENEEKNEKFNKKYNEIGVSRDLMFTSFDMFKFCTTGNTQKKDELYEELKEEIKKEKGVS